MFPKTVVSGERPRRKLPDGGFHGPKRRSLVGFHGFSRNCAIAVDQMRIENCLVSKALENSELIPSFLREEKAETASPSSIPAGGSLDRDTAPQEYLQEKAVTF